MLALKTISRHSYVMVFLHAYCITSIACGKQLCVDSVMHIKLTTGGRRVEKNKRFKLIIWIRHENEHKFIYYILPQERKCSVTDCLLLPRTV